MRKKFFFSVFSAKKKIYPKSLLDIMYIFFSGFIYTTRGIEHKTRIICQKNIYS